MDYTNFISAKLIFVAIVLFFLLAYWVFNFIILYHLDRFGIGTQPKKFAVVFFLGSICLFFVSALFFANLDLNSLKNRLGEIVTNSAFSVTYQQ